MLAAATQHNWGIPVGDTRSVELPQDLPILERSAVRLVVLDIDERVLLFQIREPLDPDQRIQQPRASPGVGVPE